MPKRYYCECCNKSFQDNPRNRAKHMKGFSHLRSKELHYQNVPPLSAEELQRLTVFHNVSSGEELFQQWLREHPAVVKKYEELSSHKDKCKEEPKCVDALSEHLSPT